MPTVADLLRALDAEFPFARAESWDKIGLHIGDEAAPVESVYVAYEITDEVVEAAREHSAIVCYHPLLFRPLENLDFKNHTARLAAKIVAQNQNLICVHTALDGASPPNALGDALAAQLGFEKVKVAKASGFEKLVKIVTFVPSAHLERVCEAMWQAGAGRIGRYGEASFRTRGTGTFDPLEGANPRVGTVGIREETDEWRVEIIAPELKRRDVVAALERAHPYEEVACDVYPLLNDNPNQKYGPLRVGEIEPKSFVDFARDVGMRLNAPNLRIVRAPAFVDEPVQVVACSPGAGASFIDALAPGTCFVSGDFKHHDALKARARGVSLIDVTHAATEVATLDLMARALANVTVKIEISELPTNPFGIL